MGPAAARPKNSGEQASSEPPETFPQGPSLHTFAYPVGHFPHAKWDNCCQYRKDYKAGKPYAVPAWPCALDPTCTPDNRVCDFHKYVIFIKMWSQDEPQGGESFEVPARHFECNGWIKDRVTEITGIPQARIRLIFAGSQLEDHRSHSGLQYGSTIHCVTSQGG